MENTKQFLLDRYKRLATDDDRYRLAQEIATKQRELNKLYEKQKYFSNERELLENAYVEVLKAENPFVYASTTFYTQSMAYHVEGIWRVMEHAVKFMEEVCDDEDSDYQRCYEKTKKPRRLTEFDTKEIEILAKRELEDNV